jgi:hypothetical protein
MHLSFSSIKDFNFCPFYYKLTRIEKLKPFNGNIYTAFGTAIHSACEQILKKRGSKFDPMPYFSKEFDKEISSLDEAISDKDKKSFHDSGVRILKNVPKFMKDNFGDFEVIDTEKNLRVPVPFEEDLITEFDFVGYVDCIIKTSDGRHHIIDWKTCSWGWDARRKADKMTTYQLSYYKFFYKMMTGTDFDNIDTHFVLMKRTTKNFPIELVKVPNGEQKTNNALKLLETAAYNVDNENFIKNKLSCSKCDFHRTEHCP